MSRINTVVDAVSVDTIFLKFIKMDELKQISHRWWQMMDAKVAATRDLLWYYSLVFWYY